MSLKPCKITVTETGKVYDYEAIKEWLVENEALWKAPAKAEKAPTAPAAEGTGTEGKGKPRPKVKAPDNYGKATELLVDNAQLTEEEVADYLPSYLYSQTGMSEKSKPSEIKRQWNLMLVSDPDSLIVDDGKGNEGKMSKKIADWVRGEQTKKGFLDSQIEASEAIIAELRGSATSGGALVIKFYQAYIAVLKAAKAAGNAISAAQARIQARKQLVDEGNSPSDVDAAIQEYLKTKSVKPAIQKTVGIKRSTKSEVQRMIDRAFAIGMGEGTQKGFTKGATEGMRAGAIEGRTQAVDMLRNALAELEGELSPKQARAIVERMGRMKTFSEAAKQGFIDYAEKVIDDANYILQERKGNAVKAAVKAMSKRKNIPANDQFLYKAFSSLSVSHLTPDALAQYIEWGDKIQAKALSPGDRAALTDFVETAQSNQERITRERSEKMKATRTANLRAEYDDLVSNNNLPPGVTTFDEFVEYKKPKPKGDGIQERINAINARLDEIPQGENGLIDQLRTLDLSVLTKEDLDLIDNSLYNYIDTGQLYGIGAPISKAEYLGRVEKALREGLKTRRQLDSKDAKILGTANLFSTIGGIKDASAKLRALLIQPWLSAATKANTSYIKIEADLTKKADKLKIAQKNWNRIDLFGFLNEAEGNPELFEQLKQQKLSDLETLKEKVEQNKKEKDISNTAENQERAYNALKESIESMGLTEESTLESVKAKLSENELEFYNETRKYLDEYSPRAIENMGLYGNREVGITKNYWPRTTNRIYEKGTGVAEFELYGSEYVGKNMFGRQKGRSRLLGKAGYYTPVGQENYFNGLKETMLIADAAHEYHGIAALYNTPNKGFSQLIKGQGANDVKQLLIDWIMDTKNVGKFSSGTVTLSQDIAHEVQKSLTGSLIGNPLQFFKQPTALAMTFAEAPEAFLKATGLIAEAMVRGKDHPLTKAINGLFDETTLGLRIEHPEILQIKEQFAMDRPKVIRDVKNILKEVNTVFGGRIIIPTDVMVSKIATLTGYIQQAERGGKKFNIFAEQEQGYNLDAIAAAEQMQSITNNENSAIYFSKRQLENRALYYLGNFQANAVRNLYINFRKVATPISPQERAEGLRGIAGYMASMALFNTMALISVRMATELAIGIYQKIANLLGDDEDDEEEKKKIYEYLNSRLKLDLQRRAGSEVIGMLTGVYGLVARAGVELAAAGLEQLYYKTTEEKEPLSERVFFAPEGMGYAGVVAETMVSPFEETLKASDPQTESMVQTSLMLAKFLGQSGIAFLIQNLNKAKGLKEKADKSYKAEARKEVKEKISALDDKKIKEELVKAIDEQNIPQTKNLIESLASAKEVSFTEAAKEIRKTLVEDKVEPFEVNEEKKRDWINYIFLKKGGNIKIRNVEISNLVPEDKRERYIDEYKKQRRKANAQLNVLQQAFLQKEKGSSINLTLEKGWLKYVAEAEKQMPKFAK